MSHNKSAMELAVYGKGGIGKSTVSANLSAALAVNGQRVMQIGCDPKHDSTRLLMHGLSIPTVLDYLRTVEKDKGDLNQVLRQGFHKIGCIEAGGPRPGVGCAGRGIISSFEFLEQHNAKKDYDIVLYDVLGDVVCGGFAVPVRREYADAIFLVTSGEFMALYAANNILRGIRNYDGAQHRRVTGIIYNERKLEDEDGRVDRFAKAVGLPICAKIPRSSVFARAEQQNRTLMEMDHCEKEQRIFRNLASQIHPEMVLYEAAPLSDEELESVVLQTGNKFLSESDWQTENNSFSESRRQTDTILNTSAFSSAEQTNHTADTAALPNPVKNRLPLYGCAFNGAATAAVQLTDAIVIAHSPRACAFYTWQNISSPGRKNLFNRGILMSSSISPNLECTQMDQTDVVFGGLNKLRSHISAALERKPGSVIVISSCVSGIIGDDIRALEEMSTADTRVIAIPADGDIAGDYMEGIRLCHHTLAEKIIDPTVKPETNSINLIGEAGVSNNREANYLIVKKWLDSMNIKINCRFLGEAATHDVKNLLKAPLNILSSDSADARDLKEWLSARYPMTFMEEVLPIGAPASEQWIRKIGAYFQCEEKAEQLIHGQREYYQQQIKQLKPALKEKKVFITTINMNLDWLFQVLEDLEMQVVFVGVLNYLHQTVKVSDQPQKYNIDENFNGDRTEQLLTALKPDVVLANYVTQPEDGDYLVDSMPMSPMIGFESGLEIAKRWAGMLQTRRKGGWMNDKVFFEKYYS